MSNHSIGYAISNYFIPVLMQSHDNKEINYETLLTLFNAIRDTVDYADGNFHEAIDSISDCRCGKCLKKIESSERLYSLSDADDFCSEELKNKIWYDNPSLIHRNLCLACFDKFIETNGNPNDVAEHIRQRIIECEDNYD